MANESVSPNLGDAENMNHVVYDAAGSAIQTLTQIHAILNAYAAIDADETTKARILWAAETLAEQEIERQEKAQRVAIKAEIALEGKAN
ncbi:hypothetical protein K3217_05360 [bacterium BD-1]|nr:hypothetical protein [Ottowia caeni]